MKKYIDVNWQIKLSKFISYLVFLGCTVADLESPKNEFWLENARFSLLKYEFFEDLKSFKLSIYSFISLSIFTAKINKLKYY